MEVAAQRMHESLSGDVEKMGKFGKFSTKKTFEILFQIGEGGGYQFLRHMGEGVN